MITYVFTLILMCQGLQGLQGEISLQKTATLAYNPHKIQVCVCVWFLINVRTPVLNWQPVHLASLLPGDFSAGFQKTRLSGGKTNYVRPHFEKKTKMVLESQCCQLAERESRTSPAPAYVQHVYFQMTHPECRSSIILLFMQQEFSSERGKQSTRALLLFHQLRCRI